MSSHSTPWITRLLWILVAMDAVRASLMDHDMSYDDIESYHYHPCRRPCTNDEPPQVCEYDFLLEHYHTLTKACYNCPFSRSDCFRPHCVPTDGSQRGIIVVNRRMPGPAIHVCEKDTIRVRVHNKLEMNEGVTIHWHGVLQQGTPYMDGVAMVTQCAIPTHTSFTYTFMAATPGTHFWHAHSGLLRSDGVFGHLVIRQPPVREPHFGLYDLDMPNHAVLIMDWWDRSVAPSFADHHHSLGTNKPTSMLINGKGMYKVFQDPISGENATTPRAEFVVHPGKTHRFRVASNGILNCPTRISVDDHMLTVIASDGAAVEPIEVESFSIFAGERYDFILNANKPIGSYLMRAVGAGDCSEKFNGASQTAIIRYEGAVLDHTLNPPAPELNGIELNPMNTLQSDTRVYVSELKAVHHDDPAVTRTPDKRITVGMEFNKINNPRFHNKEFYSLEALETNHDYTPQMNHISLAMPPAPALTQLEDIPSDMFCTEDTMKYNDCERRFCECVYLHKVKLGDVVEVILVDEGHTWDANHPIHLHGHGFRVMAMGKIGRQTDLETVLAMDAAGNITRNFDRPPVKDTVTVNDGGYTIVRFHANNPGIWFMHCHIDYHSAIGMGFLLQVGEPSEFPPRPPRFPQCGSWDGEGLEEEEDKDKDKDRNDGGSVGDDDGYHRGGATANAPALIAFVSTLLCVGLVRR